MPAGTLITGLITIITTVIGIVVPLTTAIESCYRNKREANRLLVEQEHKIRQTYLDRVLKPGLSNPEQANIYSLLSRLKQDPVIQDWANENLKRLNKIIVVDNRLKEERIIQRKKIINKIKRGQLQISKVDSSKTSTRINQLERSINEIEQSQNSATPISGDVRLGGLIHEVDKLVGQQSGVPEFILTDLKTSTKRTIQVNFTDGSFSVDIPPGEYELACTYNGIIKYKVKFSMLTSRLLRFLMEKGEFVEMV